MYTIDDLHRALGEFLTACSKLENSMFAFIWACDEKQRDLETMFEAFSGMFGQKICQFEKAYGKYPFGELRKTELAHITMMLRDLRPKRNSLVHGETHEVGFNGELAAPYRIGVTIGFDYLNKFVADKNSAHVFDVPRIQQTCAQCRDIRNQITVITTELMTARVNPSSSA